jgi:uncharacterized membrane protein YfcA
MEFSLELIGLLFAVAILAGVIDTLAGGGGLITIPALMLSGMSPINALGTNKLQGCLGTGTATVLLLRKSKIRWRHIRPLVLGAFLGSALGTVAVHFVNQKYLTLAIPLVLTFIAVYFMFYKPGKAANRGTRVSGRAFTYAVIPGIGFYDGMFGPGTGSFFTLSSVMLRRAKLIAATATAKPLNFATNFSSLIVFTIYGNVVGPVGLVMMLGQFIGAWAGVHFLYKIDPNKLRLLVVTMCIVMLGKYLESSGGISLGG